MQQLYNAPLSIKNSPYLLDRTNFITAYDHKTTAPNLFCDEDTAMPSYFTKIYISTYKYDCHTTCAADQNTGIKLAFYLLIFIVGIVLSLSE